MLRLCSSCWCTTATEPFTTAQRTAGAAARPTRCSVRTKRSSSMTRFLLRPAGSKTERSACPGLRSWALPPKVGRTPSSGGIVLSPLRPSGAANRSLHVTFRSGAITPTHGCAPNTSATIRSMRSKAPPNTSAMDWVYTGTSGTTIPTIRTIPTTCLPKRALPGWSAPFSSRGPGSRLTSTAVSGTPRRTAISATAVTMLRAASPTDRSIPKFIPPRRFSIR